MENIHGFILINKHKGITSRRIIDYISKSLKIKKVGHAGTLDPLASGLLPVAIGEATKIISFVQNMKKNYTFKVNWGKSTTTDDLEGEELLISSNRPTKNEILKIIPNFQGEIKQIPPNFSAIKIDGQRSYKLARKKLQINHKARIVNIYNLKLKKYIDENVSEFTVTCSKGTYVRSLARDLGKYLNTEAHIIELKRKCIGIFSLENAILLDLSKKLIHSPLILKNLITIDAIMRNFPSLKLNRVEAKRIKYGQRININEIENFGEFVKFYPNFNEIENVYCFINKNPIALLKIRNEVVKPIKVFNV